GLRPTHESLPMQGVFPFVEQLDTVGPFTQTLGDMVMAYRALANRPALSDQDTSFRVARLGGWFQSNGDPEGNAGVDAIGAAFGNTPLIELPLAEAARSAAFLITAKYGGLLHRETLQHNAMGYDPAVRDRLVAGVALSDAKVDAANAIILAFNQQVQAALSEFDILIAPTTPSVAPKVSDGWIDVGGRRVSARANLGLYTQPLSVAGVPILSVPLKRPGKLPLGIQLISRKHAEESLFNAAARLVKDGLVGFTPPQLALQDVTS
ncbi:MAG: amidase family protein, partial [Pseudomonadota bacterium]